MNFMTSIQIIQLIINILIPLLIGIICFIFFRFTMSLSSKTKQLSEEALEDLEKRVQNSVTGNKMKRYLSQMGIMYRMGDYNLSPVWYYMLRIGLGFLFSILSIFFFEFHITFIIIGFFLGYFGIDLFFKSQNQTDNKEMLMDIYNTYACMKIQLGCGFYILDSLTYAYKLAVHPRFKDALSELISNISNKTIGYEDAVALFKGRFLSEDINKLSSVLLNYTRYGQSEAYMQDIMNEIRGILSAVQMEEKHKTKMKSGMVCFAFFALVIALVFYVMIKDFSKIIIF